MVPDKRIHAHRDAKHGEDLSQEGDAENCYLAILQQSVCHRPIICSHIRLFPRIVIALSCVTCHVVLFFGEESGVVETLRYHDKSDANVSHLPFENLAVRVIVNWLGSILIEPLQVALV